MAETVNLSRIAAIMFGVRDLPQAVAFYKDKLGLKIIMQEPALALLQCGTVMLGLSPRHVRPEAPVAGATEVSFGVDDLRWLQVAHLAHLTNARSIPRPSTRLFGFVRW